MANLESMPDRSAAASELVAACEHAWRSIQRHHPGLPDVVVVLGTGVERGRLVKLGHWWGGRWIADGQVRGEVLLAGEALHLQPTDVFEVLLHEAGHGLNAARGIKDASRGGRYHNAHFKATAEELGLVVASMAPYGWARTSVGAEASSRYDGQIKQLGDAMRIARRLSANVRLGEAKEGEQDHNDAGRETTAREQPKQGPATCGCGRKMRMAPSVLAQGPVLCGLCGQEFSPEHHVERGQQRQRVADWNTTPVNEPFLVRRRAALVAERRAPSTRAGSSASDLPVVELTEDQRLALRHLTDLTATASGVALIAEVGAWREAHRQGDPRPLIGRSNADVERANYAARALLVLDCELVGDPAIVAGRKLLVGELVMIGDASGQLLDVDGIELPPARVLGTVATIDHDARTLDVDFPIAGRHRLAIDSPAAAALEYGYAEQVAYVGAPLIDLRTLPGTNRSAVVELSIVPDLSW